MTLPDALGCLGMRAGRKLALMETQPRPRTQVTDPTGVAVANNLRRVRGRKRWSTYELSRRLAKAGRPMTPSAIAKVERCERRGDVGDLMALAAVLNVSPSALLLPMDDSPTSTLRLTGAGEVPADVAWDWVDGKRPLRIAEGDAEASMLEYALVSRPPRRRRPRAYAKGERTPEQLASIRRHWERLIEMGAVDPNVVARLDPEVWAEAGD